eukprot:1858207-Pleurochrysis_carterae.AAC.2
MSHKTRAAHASRDTWSRNSQSSHRCSAQWWTQRQYVALWPRHNHAGRRVVIRQTAAVQGRTRPTRAVQGRAACGLEHPRARKQPDEAEACMPLEGHARMPTPEAIINARKTGEMITDTC